MQLCDVLSVIALYILNEEFYYVWIMASKTLENAKSHLHIMTLKD
jgi:hypothetical protein